MSEPFVLRPLMEADLAAVAAIEEASDLPSRSLEARQQELGDERTRAVVLEVGGEVVAVGSLWLAPDDAHITSLAVAGEARRRGHGRRLVTALVALAGTLGAEAATLEVRASNGAARALYRGCGFEEVGERRRYYPDGEDAVIMTLALGDEARAASDARG
ncbi:MAG: ribosomal protein S18-alanine N-acetyltransferase [Chloroflexi bacterium]|nr:ribosomal protein S18-alanine N-acetyltransferase [Chloroflexota bacterium]